MRVFIQPTSLLDGCITIYHEVKSMPTSRKEDYYSIVVVDAKKKKLIFDLLSWPAFLLINIVGIIFGITIHLLLESNLDFILFMVLFVFSSSWQHLLRTLVEERTVQILYKRLEK